jgi:hypothetical protein
MVKGGALQRGRGRGGLTFESLMKTENEYSEHCDEKLTAMKSDRSGEVRS